MKCATDRTHRFTFTQSFILNVRVRDAVAKPLAAVVLSNYTIGRSGWTPVQLNRKRSQPHIFQLDPRMRRDMLGRATQPVTDVFLIV